MQNRKTRKVKVRSRRRNYGEGKKEDKEGWNI